jgi:hypothetical protein
MKIKIRKWGQLWFVLIPGDIPSLPYFPHFSDALAMVQQELRQRWKKDHGPTVVK